MSDVQQLQVALSQVPPRSAQVLLARCAPGVTHAAFAAQYGLGEGPAELLLYRSAGAFSAALAGTAPPRPAPFALEVEQARELRLALEHGSGSGAAAALVDLTAHHAEVVQALARAEALAETSPAFRRGVWLRRLAIAAIVGLSLWFYWRDHQADLAPRFEPRPVQQR